jgi:tetratricopeptide (TPR) repeat protein
MTRRMIRTAVLLLALGALAVALRHDLADRAVARGMARLSTGDVAGAEADFRRAAELGKPAAPLSYNLGVALYRKGEHVQARQRFDAAIAAAGPDLLPAARYNRGNSLYRQAEGLAGQDGEAAASLFSQAAADYRRALALAPGDADARANLELAQARHLALTSAAAGAEPARQTGARRTGTAADSVQAARADSARRAASREPASASRSTGQTMGQPEDTRDQARGGKPPQALSREEVARLLGEARGRERPMGRLHGGGRLELPAGPDRDW